MANSEDQYRTQTIDDNVDGLVTNVGTPTVDLATDIKMSGWNFLYTVETDSENWTTPDTLFTITGDVLVKIAAVCTESCTTSDAITIEVGVSGDTARLIAQIADATDLLIGEVYEDATPTTKYVDISELQAFPLISGEDIIQTTTGTWTAGKLIYFLWWLPISATGDVVATIAS